MENNLRRRQAALKWWNSIGFQEQEYAWEKWKKITTSPFKEWPLIMFDRSSSAIQLLWVEMHANCERADLKGIPGMIEKGYEPVFVAEDKRAERTGPHNWPHNGVTFSKGTHHVWPIINRKEDTSAWMTADLIDGHYTNHKQIATLEELAKL